MNTLTRLEKGGGLPESAAGGSMTRRNTPAARPGTLYASAEVAMTGELETHNNAAVGATRLESVISLPVVLRQ